MIKKHIGLTFLVGIFLFAGNWLRAADTFTASSYQDLFGGIAQNYTQGFSGDPFENPDVKTKFSNPTDGNLLFKLAAESDIRRLRLGKQDLLIVHPSFWDFGQNKNLLRDKFDNSDFYLIRVTENGFEAVGRMPLHRSCKEGRVPKKNALFFNCVRFDQVNQTVDVYSWDGATFAPVNSQESIRTGR